MPENKKFVSKKVPASKKAEKSNSSKKTVIPPGGKKPDTQERSKSDSFADEIEVKLDSLFSENDGKPREDEMRYQKITEKIEESDVSESGSFVDELEIRLNDLLSETDEKPQADENHRKIGAIGFDAEKLIHKVETFNKIEGEEIADIDGGLPEADREFKKRNGTKNKLINEELNQGVDNHQGVDAKSANRNLKTNKRIDFVRFSDEKKRPKKFGLKQNALIFQTAVFILPFMSLLYIFIKSEVNLDFSGIIIICFTLILILSIMVFVRQIFDKIINISNSMKTVQSGEDRMLEFNQDIYELHAISVSFNLLLEKFKKTSSELTHRAFQLLTIKDLTEAVSKRLDIKEILEILLEKAMDVSKAQIGSILTFDGEKQSFQVIEYREIETRLQKNSYIQIVKATLNKVVSNRRAHIVQNIKADLKNPKTDDTEDNLVSFLSIPIIVNKDWLAVLSLADKENREAFDSNDEEILSIIIGEIDFAMKNAVLYSNFKANLMKLQDRSKELVNANDELQKAYKEIERLKQAA